MNFSQSFNLGPKKENKVGVEKDEENRFVEDGKKRESRPVILPGHKRLNPGRPRTKLPEESKPKKTKKGRP